MKTNHYPLIIGLLTISIYILTVIPAFKYFAASFFIIYFLLVILGFLLIIFLFTKKKSSKKIRLSFLMLITVVLLWVGITGWFMSPFYYLLFLMAISIGFIFSSSATITFVIILIIFFLPNIGSIDILPDLIMLLSLISIIPLNYFIQKEYLKLKETEKKLLIIQEINQHFKNKVDQFLANKIIKLAMEIRQSASDIKHIADFSKKQQDAKKTKKKLEQISQLSSQILETIESFERKTTGEKLIHRKKD